MKSSIQHHMSPSSDSGDRVFESAWCFEHILLSFSMHFATLFLLRRESVKSLEILTPMPVLLSA